MYRLPAIAGCLLLLACAQRSDPAAVTQSEVAALFAPEEGSAAADYTARISRLRLFGVQGVGSSEASATLADTASWATQSWRVGELIARNFRVGRIDQGGVTLESSDGAVRLLSAGAEAEFRLVRHAFDLAAVAQGANQWVVEPSTLARLRTRHGLGVTTETFELQDRAGLVFVEVAPEGLFGRLGIQSGDVLLAVDGIGATAADLGRVADRLSVARSDLVTLSLRRGGTVWDAKYATR